MGEQPRENEILKEGERLDEIGFGGCRLIQGTGFSYGVDSVLLSDFAAKDAALRYGGISKGEHSLRRGACEGGRELVETGAELGIVELRVADLGSGNGIIPIIMHHKLTTRGIKVKFIGFEINPDACGRAARSAELNGLADSMRFINIDIKDLCRTASLMEELLYSHQAAVDVADEIKDSFDIVVSNPPYFKKGTSLINPEAEKAMARHEISAELSDFLEAGDFLLKDGGDLYMVHRPERLEEIFIEMRERKLEPREIMMVAPRDGEEPNIVLVHGVKGGEPGLRLLPTEAVHTEGQNYTSWIDEIYER